MVDRQGGNAPSNDDKKEISPIGVALHGLHNQRIVVKVNQVLSASKLERGQRLDFQIISPANLTGVPIEGRVLKRKASGKLKGRSELRILFERFVGPEKEEVPIEVKFIQLNGPSGSLTRDEGGRELDVSRNKIGSGGFLSSLGAILGGPRKTAHPAAESDVVVLRTRGEDLELGPNCSFVLEVTSLQPIEPEG